MRTQRIVIGILLTSALITLSPPAQASLEVAMPATRVTVFPDRAAVTRDTTLDLQAGSYTIKVKNLPPRTMTESIRASVRGVEGITLLGLKYRIENRLEAVQEQTAELERRLARLREHDRQIQTDRLDAFQGQKKLLASLSASAGDQMAAEVHTGTLHVTDWDAALRFVGSRTKEVNDSIRIVQDSISRLDAQIGLLDSELRQTPSGSPNQVFIVDLELELAKAGQVNLSLDYVVMGATWKPLYEARLADSGNVEFIYDAEVAQVTGEDWKQVELTLSTAMPAQGVGPDETRPYYLTLRERYLGSTGTVDDLLKHVAGVRTDSTGEVYIRGGRAGEVSYIVDGVPLNDPLGGLEGLNSQLALVPGAIVGTGSYVTVFRVSRPETIPSGGKETRARIATYRLDATKNLISRPRTSPGAYRLLTITNQPDAPLMPGNVAIFDGPNYLGGTTISEFVAPGQEFKLPFGLENLVKVERKVLGYKKSQSGDKVRIEQTISIELKNLGRSVCQLALEEPMPISQDNRVKVTLGDIVPPALQTDTEGRATWNLSIPPNELVTITIPYKIEYPAAMVLSGF